VIGVVQFLSEKVTFTDAKMQLKLALKSA